MMNEPGKSDSAIVAVKPTNKAGKPAAEPAEPRAGTQGECEPAKHGPGAEPDNRVTGAGAHTESRTSGSPSLTQGGSRVRESRSHGTVRGAASNSRPYRASL